MTILREYAAYAGRTGFEDIPGDLVELAKLSIMDTAGVACNAAATEEAARFRSYAAEQFGHRREASVIGDSTRLTTAGAAFLNGALAHIDDYDEVSLPGHAAVATVPAALALAESRGLDGRELLRIYILGLELSFRLAGAMVDKLWVAGWHTTPVFGTMACAAMAAMAMKLPPAAFADALGLAASRASGLQANFGTMAKPFHVGMAGVNGIDSADLARHGIDANRGVLEAPRGYADCFIRDAEAARGISFGHGWEIRRNGMLFKKYPCCVASHSAIETMARMVREHGLAAGSVDSVLVGLDQVSMGCMQYPMPENSLQAKFSMSFPLAMVLLNGVLGPADFSDETVARPDVRAVMGVIGAEAADAFRAVYSDPDIPCLIRVTLKNGAVLEERGKLPYFGPDCWNNPAPPEAVREKFTVCAGKALGNAGARRALDLLSSLESHKTTHELMAALTPRS